MCRGCSCGVARDAAPDVQLGARDLPSAAVSARHTRPSRQRHTASAFYAEQILTTRLSPVSRRQVEAPDTDARLERLRRAEPDDRLWPASCHQVNRTEQARGSARRRSGMAASRRLTRGLPDGTLGQRSKRCPRCSNDLAVRTMHVKPGVSRRLRRRLQANRLILCAG